MNYQQLHHLNLMYSHYLALDVCSLSSESPCSSASLACPLLSPFPCLFCALLFRLSVVPFQLSSAPSLTSFPLVLVSFSPSIQLLLFPCDPSLPSSCDIHPQSKLLLQLSVAAWLMLFPQELKECQKGSLGLAQQQQED